MFHTHRCTVRKFCLVTFMSGNDWKMSIYQLLICKHRLVNETVMMCRLIIGCNCWNKERLQTYGQTNTCTTSRMLQSSIQLYIWFYFLSRAASQLGCQSVSRELPTSWGYCQVKYSSNLAELNRQQCMSLQCLMQHCYLLNPAINTDKRLSAVQKSAEPCKFDVHCIPYI